MLPLLAFALDAWALTPAMRIPDAYKWLFQAVRGGEHAAADEATVRARLAREWQVIGPARATATAIEPLRPDGLVVRLHLAAARDRGVSQAAVLDAFIASARRPLPDEPTLATCWRALGDVLRTQPHAALTHGAWTTLQAALAERDYPAIRHSAAYVAAYAPAYRVMRGDVAAALLASSDP